MNEIILNKPKLRSNLQNIWAIISKKSRSGEQDKNENIHRLEETKMSQPISAMNYSRLDPVMVKTVEYLGKYESVI